jgi:hypothetical protein
MSANRKRQQFNDRVNEKHERKAQKEEETRLLKMQKVKVKKSWKPMFEPNLTEYDFAALESRIEAYYPDHIKGEVNV